MNLNLKVPVIVQKRNYQQDDIPAAEEDHSVRQRVLLGLKWHKKLRQWVLLALLCFLLFHLFLLDGNTCLLFVVDSCVPRELDGCHD